MTEEQRQLNREAQRRYREKHKEKIAAKAAVYYKRPEVQARRLEARLAKGLGAGHAGRAKMSDDERKARMREAGKRYRLSHPKAITEKQKEKEAAKRFRTENPELAREQDREKRKEYARRYRAQNLEQVSAREKRWHLENAERLYATAKAKRQQNPEPHNAWNREWASRNKDKIKAKNAKRYRSLPEERKARISAKTLLSRQTGVPVRMLPKELVDLNTAYLLLIRAVKEAKKSGTRRDSTNEQAA